MRPGPANMKRIRRFYIPIVFAVAVSLTGYAIWMREPVYEGRDLSSWLRELAELASQAPSVEGNESEQRAWDARHDEAVTAIRSIGNKALPHLLRCLRSAPGPTPLRDKLEELLDKQSVLNIKLPRRRDHTDQAILGFQALGSVAKPATKELRGLLHNPVTADAAVDALCAIGPAAVPTLAPELTNSNCPAQFQVVEAIVNLAQSVGPSIVPVLVEGVTNPGCHVHAECLAGLGDLGPLARQYAPWLGALAREPGNPLAGSAMWVVAGVSDRPEQYLSLCSTRLTDTNFAGHAAFALAQMGPDAVPPLLRALTNQEPIIKGAALAALNPKFRNHLPASGVTFLPRRFSVLRYSFDLDCRMWISNPRVAPGRLLL